MHQVPTGADIYQIHMGGMALTKVYYPFMSWFRDHGVGYL